jgi:hypothetical protein
LPPDSILVTFDVTSLYTNIPNKEGIEVVKHALQSFRPDHGLKPSNNSLVKLTEFVLSKNNFKFNGEHFLQIGGTAMGTKMAPNFANLYLAYFEELYVYTYSFQPIFWVRFLDDCFCIFTHGPERLDEFLSYLNNCNPSIKFTMEASKKSVNFLDTTVKIIDQQLVTDLYCKPTDAHNYLLYSSAHPRSCKQSIPYSQFLRVRRICTNLSDYDKHSKMLGTHFLRRGYPLHLIEQAAIKARRLNRESLLAPTAIQNLSTEEDDKIVLVTTYNPYDNTVKQLANQNWDLLGKSTNTTFLHEKRLMTAYRRPKNMRDLLVRADCQIKQPQTNSSTVITQTTMDLFLASGNTQPEVHASSSTSDIHSNHDTNLTASRSIGTLQLPIRSKNTCKSKKCRYCPLLDTCGTTTCTVSGETFTTKMKVTCRSSNLIYCITCKICHKQYVGQTKRKILERFQGHFYNVKMALDFYQSKNKPGKNVGRAPKDAVGMHFSRNDHNGTQDMKIQVLEFMHLPPQSERGKTLRLKIEKAWIHRLRCTAPHGLNIFD